MKYWTVIEGEGDNYGAFVPDVTGAVGAGDTAEQAAASVAKSLAVMLEDLVTRGLERPAPTPRDQLDLSEYPVEQPYELVEVEPVELNPISLAIERARLRQGWSKVELAKRMGAKAPLINRLENPFYWGHSSDTLRKVATAFGAEMEVTFKTRELVDA